MIRSGNIIKPWFHLLSRSVMRKLTAYLKKRDFISRLIWSNLKAGQRDSSGFWDSMDSDMSAEHQRSCIFFSEIESGQQILSTGSWSMICFIIRFSSGPSRRNRLYFLMLRRNNKLSTDNNYYFPQYL